jgi:hypothetical protein
VSVAAANRSLDRGRSLGKDGAAGQSSYLRGADAEQKGVRAGWRSGERGEENRGCSGGVWIWGTRRGDEGRQWRFWQIRYKTEAYECSRAVRPLARRFVAPGVSATNLPPRATGALNQFHKN